MYIGIMKLTFWMYLSASKTGRVRQLIASVISHIHLDQKGNKKETN